MQRAIDVKEHKRRDSPTRKSIFRYGRHKFEISRTVFFFLLHETLYTVRIIRSMLSLKSSKNRTFEILFSFIVCSSRNAGILIIIPSIVANSWIQLSFKKIYLFKRILTNAILTNANSFWEELFDRFIKI